MLYIIVGLFAFAAVVGAVILRSWLVSAPASRTVVYMHGIFAAAALVLLLAYAIQNGTKGLSVALVFFIAAALGGFYMFFRDLNGKVSPIWLAGGHALLALTGFVLLLVHIL